MSMTLVLNTSMYNLMLQCAGTAPSCSASNAFSKVYTIEPGDTMSSIATRCSVALTSLEAQNSQIADFGLIQAGAQVRMLAVISMIALQLLSACLLESWLESTLVHAPQNRLQLC